MSLFAGVKYDSLLTFNISKDNQSLAFPNLGGFSSPLLAELDIDHDGRKDLIIFERYPYKVQTFINNGTTGGAQVSYDYAPELEDRIPTIGSYILVRDMNCDQVDDVIERGLGGVKIHFGAYDLDDLWYSSSSTELAFTDPPSGPYGNIYVTPNGDVPIINDVDGDGDMDVVAFDVFFPGLNFYKSFKTENNLACDSFDYRIGSWCYGNVLRNSCNWDSYSCKTDGSGKTTHSTLVAMYSVDADGDGDLDILSGASDCNTLTLLYNTGTNTNPVFGNQDTVWSTLSQTTPSMNTFLAPNPIDYNNDGNMDLVITVNSYSANDMKQFWPIKNQSNFALNAYEDPTSFFHRLTLDEGTRSRPVVADEDLDGKLDILLAVESSKYANIDTGSHIVYMQNVGTSTNASFKILDTDFLGMSALGRASMHPAIGDIDNDGDKDLLIGHSDGFIIYTNIATSPNAKPVYSNPDTVFTALDDAKISNPSRFFKNLVPIFYDIDNDGDEDIICGERYGNLFLFENLGSIGAIDYSLSTIQLGDVDVSGDGDPIFSPLSSWEGYSVPSISVIDSSDTARLVVGSRTGFLYTYRLSLPGSPFTLLDSTLAGTKNRYFSAPSFGEFDAGSIPFMVLGNYHGGLEFYAANQYVGSDAIDPIDQAVDGVYPNPSKGEFQFYNKKGIKYPMFYATYDALGRLVASGTTKEDKIKLDLPPGNIYMLQLIDAEQKTSTFQIQIEN